MDSTNSSTKPTDEGIATKGMDTRSLVSPKIGTKDHDTLSAPAISTKENGTLGAGLEPTRG